MKGRVGGEERKVLVCCDVTIRGGSTQGHFRMSCRNIYTVERYLCPFGQYSR